MTQDSSDFKISGRWLSWEYAKYKGVEYTRYVGDGKYRLFSTEYGTPAFICQCGGISFVLLYGKRDLFGQCAQCGKVGLIDV